MSDSSELLLSVYESLSSYKTFYFLALPRLFSSVLFLNRILSSPACFKSLIISSSLCSSKGSRLNLKVPENRVGSYGITVIESLNCSKGIFEILTPSIIIFPLSIYTIRVILLIKVLFPAPVLPTMPIFSPLLILKSTPFRTSSLSGLYLKWTSWYSMSPIFGQVLSYSLFITVFVSY